MSSPYRIVRTCPGQFLNHNVLSDATFIRHLGLQQWGARIFPNQRVESRIIVPCTLPNICRIETRFVLQLKYKKN